MGIKLEDYSKEELIKTILELKNEKRFGLVWEDKPEQVALDCETKLPVLQEADEKIITGSKDATHLIIEGDNYHSLSVLNYTHPNAVDVIYIDPPYNTGNKDFIYNDNYVDKEDTFRHSKWLSFMSKRLLLAKSLLKESGLIFISIDDNEQSNLTLLCKQIFGEENYIATLPTVMNLKGNNDQFGFAGTHEYTIVFAKNKKVAQINSFKVDEEEVLESWLEDEIGYYKQGANLKATGTNAPRSKRPNLFYPIFVNENDEVYATENDKPHNPSHKKLLPITNGNEMSWRWSKKKLNLEPHNIILNGDSIYKKQRPQLGDIPSAKPKSIFYKPEYSSGNGTAVIKEIFGDKVFNNPKPLDLIKDLIYLGSSKEAVILDFMAGSGTTGHAVIELNKEDGGDRKFILCTNNENKIAENITYQRINKISKGYGNIEGVPLNLRYFKTDFVSKQNTNDQTRIALIERCTDMIRVREDAYRYLIDDEKLKLLSSRYHNTAIIFDPHKISESFKKIEELGDEKSLNAYIFSYSSYTYDEDIPETNLQYTLCPIPESILEVYRRIFKEEDYV